MSYKKECRAVDCYAIRRVNPFLGVYQVIETDNARAISTNGVVWDIEVLVDHQCGMGSPGMDKNNRAYYRYGLWSFGDGLVTRPLSPSLDSDPLTAHCNHIIECISDNLSNLPFPLIDTSELWLYESDGNELLVLLASIIPGADRPSPEPKTWRSCLGANGVASQIRYPFTAELEQQVKQCAGFNITKRWIMRNPDGSGRLENDGTEISADMFPPYLLNDHLFEGDELSIVQNYFRWISPSLLTLQSLTKSQRQHLEENLFVQAISIEHHRQLFPEIIDDNAIRAARVQCRLQKANER